MQPPSLACHTWLPLKIHGASYRQQQGHGLNLSVRGHSPDKYSIAAHIRKAQDR